MGIDKMDTGLEKNQTNLSARHNVSTAARRRAMIKLLHLILDRGFQNPSPFFLPGTMTTLYLGQFYW
jgi:hypothetical protein